MDIDSRKERFELVEAIVLSVAIVATAWSAYQAARWSGVQSLRLAETSAAGRMALAMRWLKESRTSSSFM